MPKSRIIISMHYLELGGAETALIGLLHALDPERVDVDLFIHSHQGPLIRFIPTWVNVLPEIKQYAMIERPMIESLRAGCLGVVRGRLLARYKHRQYLKRQSRSANYALDASIFQYVAESVTPHLPEINPGVCYDMAISFLTPHNIVRDKIKARRKLAWIHTDYSTISVNAAQELPVWNAFDNIISISADVTRAFLKTFPTLAHKIVEIENILSTEFIHLRADEFAPTEMTGNAIKLLSVGRYCHQKNFDNVPDICRRLVDMGLNVKWYIIGFGEDESLIREHIATADMSDRMIMLGRRDNPYPYIKNCDIYVQPSRYEGKSMTVREAQILCRPVIVTAYPTASSQIADGIDGVIAPMDNAACARTIADLIADNTLRQSLITHLSTHDYGAAAQVNKLYKLLP